MHGVFVEDPAKRALIRDAKGVGVPLTGTQLDSITIEVSAETYCTERFQEWVRCDLLTRLGPDAGPITIMVKTRKRSQGST